MLGFNLGIEFVQLLLVAIAAPVLIRLARKRYYTVLRLGGAGLAAVAATIWVLERVQAPSEMADAGAPARPSLSTSQPTPPSTA